MIIVLGFFVGISCGMICTMITGSFVSGVCLGAPLSLLILFIVSLLFDK